MTYPPTTSDEQWCAFITMPYANILTVKNIWKITCKLELANA